MRRNGFCNLPCSVAVVQATAALRQLNAGDRLTLSAVVLQMKCEQGTSWVVLSHLFATTEKCTVAGGLAIDRCFKHSMQALAGWPTHSGASLQAIATVSCRMLPAVHYLR